MCHARCKLLDFSFLIDLKKEKSEYRMSIGLKEFWKKGQREGVPSDIHHPRVFPTLNSNQMGIKNEWKPKGKFR